MVDIAKTPLNERIKNTSDALYAAAHSASPGQVTLGVEAFEDVIDLLQELIDIRTNLSEDLDSAYESVGAEIETQVGLGQKLQTMTQTADKLATRVKSLQAELDSKA